MLGARLPRVRPGRDAPCNCPSCSGRPSRWQPRLCSAAGVIQAPPTSGLQPRPPCALANLQSLVPPPPHARPGLADLGGTLESLPPASRPVPAPPHCATLASQLLPCGSPGLSLCLFLGLDIFLTLGLFSILLISLRHSLFCSFSHSLHLLISPPRPFPAPLWFLFPNTFICSSPILESLDHTRPPGQAGRASPGGLQVSTELLPRARHLAACWGS